MPSIVGGRIDQNEPKTGSCLVSAQLHPDGEKIIQKLRQEGICVLYHFTSIENLPSIRDMDALCSKQSLEDSDRWPPPEPGGNDLSHQLDHSTGNWDKLSLNFTPNTPMAYWKKRQSHLCFFVLELSVASHTGVLFTNTNAAAGTQDRQSGLEGLGLVDFNAVRSAPHPWDREGWVRPVQAEVLVPTQIPLACVTEVTFVSQASQEEAERLWGPARHPPFRVEPCHFADLPHLPKPVIGFPYVASVLLTDEIVDQSNYMLPRVHKSAFHRQTNGRITVFVELSALAGTRATFTWNPGGYSDTTEFEQSTEYWHWASIAMESLPDGSCFIDYCLDGIRWTRVCFELES